MKNTLFIIFAVFNITAFAQKAQCIYVATDGTLVNAKKDQVYRDSTIVEFTILDGVDPKTGVVKWTYTPLDTSLITGVDTVSNIPYIKLRTSLLTIIDPTSGRVVIDPMLFTDVSKSGFLTNPARLWVEGSLGNTHVFAMFDLASGKRLWEKSEYFILPNKEIKKRYGVDKALNKAANKILPPEDRSSPPALLCKPLFIDDENMFILVGDHFSYSDVYKVSIVDGDIEQKTPVKTKGEIVQLFYDPQGIILCATNTDVDLIVSTRHFTMVDQITGDELWSQKINFKGTLQKLTPTPKGIFYVTNKTSGYVDFNVQATK